MEGGKTDQEYDELDKLLDEIPTATTEIPYTSEPVQSGVSLGFEPMSADEVKKYSTPSNFCDLFRTPQSAKGCESNSVDNNLSLSKSPFNQEENSGNYHGALAMCADQNVSNLPDEQSLASALEDLSFKDRIEVHSTKSFFKYNPTSFSSAFLVDGHCSAHFKKPSGLGSAEMSILPSSTMLNGVYLPNPTSEGCSPFITKDEPNALNGIVDGYNDARFLKCNSHDPRDQMPKSSLGDHGEQWQSFPVCSASMPVNQGTHTFLLSGLSAQGFEFPASSFQHQYYMDSPTHAYIPCQQLSQSNMVWGDVECEGNYKNHPQYLYLQQLKNQCLEVHQAQKRINSAIAPLSGNAIQTYFHMPIPHQAGQANQYSYEINNVANRRYNQFDPSLLNSNLGRCHLNGLSGQCKSCLFPQGQKFASSCSLYYPAVSSHGLQVSERFSKQTFPEKILTRSHGLNSLQTLKSGAAANNQLPEHDDNSRRVFLNDNVHSHLIHPVGSLNLDVPRSRGSSPDNSNEKHDLKSPHLKHDSLNNVSGQIHMLAKDQNGCRFLQRIFDEGNHEDVDIIFLGIVNHVVEIMTDPFGNYLVQKLVDVCTEEQITHIIYEISKSDTELLRISCNQHGTRVVQKIIETVKSPEQSSMIVVALKPGIVSLIKNNNGSHVAQRCLEYLSPECREFLFEDAVASCVELARDRQGCCVVQKCLSALEGEQYLRLISNLTSKARELSQDPYGNYVVQYILDQEIPWATTKILDHLECHYGKLSIQKYSSNVVEKCLKFAGDDRRVNIIRELINDPHFVQILVDPYGNYVIQSARRECKGPLQIAFLEEAIRPHVPTLRDNPYGKKVLSTCYSK